MSISPPRRSASSQYIVAAGDRIAIVAGLAFLDGVASGGFGPSDLRRWIETHLVRAKRMTWSGTIQETGYGSISLHGSGDPPPALASPHRFQGLISVARKRVVLALRGLLAAPVDDRFLNAAIFSGRVQREGSSGWAPRPSGDGALSDIVLSLFAADILSHRDTYEGGLCVCDACGRVWFEPGAPQRRCCPAGVPHYGGTPAGGSIPPPSSG